MSSTSRWQEESGLETIQTIVKSKTTWIDGLRPYQLTLVARILDEEDILFISATGDGKSVAFWITILVLNEYNAHQEKYPAGLRTKKRPVGIVITPTKGLSNNHVSSIFFASYMRC